MASEPPTQRFELDPTAKQAIVRDVEEARPINDVLAWSITEYPDADREWIFGALKAIYDGNFSITPASEEQKRYQIGEEELAAYPQRVQ